MPLVRTQAILTHDSGLARDNVTNTMHWLHTGPSDSDILALCGLVKNFYTAANASGDRVDASLANALDSVYVKGYLLSDPEPRPPRAVTSATTLGSRAAATDLPAEVALALSYQALKTAGVPQSRRRGRIFLGPFVTTISTGTPARPQAGSRNVFIERFQTLKGAALASGFSLHIYSPTTGTSAPAANGWIDDAFDTIRSRGVASSSRITFTL